MRFQNLISENVWSLLTKYEFENHVRKTLLQRLDKGELQFEAYATQDVTEQRAFVSDVATAYSCVGVRQAKEFFVSAEQASEMTKPLLMYYGMMNLVKSLLIFWRPDYFLNKEHLRHGLSPGDRVQERFDYANERIRIFPEGIFPLGHRILHDEPIVEPGCYLVVKLDDVLAALPELLIRA
ncbi:MAG: YaaC family protein [Candidatus Binatia bacterium]